MSLSSPEDAHTSLLSDAWIDIALIGNPNTGKTSIFNALTGLRHKIGNYPGVTVERKSGMISGSDRLRIRLHDLPGLYSLNPKSLDERIAKEALIGVSPDQPPIRLVVVVADASNLSRNLYLVTQVIDLGLPVVAALNMMDDARASGLHIDTKTLSARLNVPVVPVIASRAEGIDHLRKTICAVLENPLPREEGTLRIDEALKNDLKPLTGWLSEYTSLAPSAQTAEALRIASSDLAGDAWMQGAHTAACKNDLQTQTREVRARLEERHIAWRMLEATLRYRQIDELYAATVHETPMEVQRLHVRLDRVLTHRIAGPAIVLLVFALIFQTIFSWAEAPMTVIETGVGDLNHHVARLIPEGTLQSLTTDGVITGVGAVVVFLPQILFLFFFLALLEDTGYLARIAFLMDRLMRSIGLSGRAVIPLLSSFACAIPGVMATRTISNWRDRLITIMIAPLMSCSARLPVYILMIGTFIPDTPVLGVFSLPGLTLLAMYLIGMSIAVLAALVLNRLFMRNMPSDTFIIELPPYRRPSLKWILLQMYERAKVFVSDAGRIIVAISIVLWFLASYPRPTSEDPPGERIAQSYAGQVGHAIEPIIAPLGFDWKLGIGLITSFAAREVMVSTLATIYNVEDGNEESVDLRTALRNEINPATGAPQYTPLVAVSLMVFFVLACQCMATVAIVGRETNSWRWPVVMIVYMTGLAYLGSLVVFQGGRMIGWG
ncbi:MAG: ferrous iron transport protein B [candidate division Zixibacteria bacterium]|nr:ferrous iron transport protein B [candidate division Zixibacteria bacterium]